MFPLSTNRAESVRKKENIRWVRLLVAKGVWTQYVCVVWTLQVNLSSYVNFQTHSYERLLEERSTTGNSICMFKKWMDNIRTFCWMAATFYKVYQVGKKQQEANTVASRWSHHPHKKIEAIHLAREYGIIILSFPAHTTHSLQPGTSGTHFLPSALE